VEFGVAAAQFTGAPLIVGAVHASPATLGTAGEGLMEEELTHESPGMLEHRERELRERVAVEKAVARATADVAGIEVEPGVSVGDPTEFLVAASENVDLLECGSRGYGPRRAVLLGGVSGHVIGEAHCPVIVLARGAEAGLDALISERAGAVG
jgi:nucleotide-binding universal stress UspA family protein